MKREDKQIRMKLREACEPEKTFEQFCGENNIEVAPQKRDTRKLLLKTLLPCVASAAVVLAVVLPITLRDTAPATKPEKPPIYGHITDNNRKIITEDELLEDKDLVMYDMSGQYSYADIVAYYTDDWKEVLFYSVSDVLWVNDLECEVPEFFFEFNYKVRCHKEFPIYDEQTYTNLNDTYECNGIQFHYEYHNNHLDNHYLYIYFKSGTYDYFLHTTEIHVTTGDNVAHDMIELLFGYGKEKNLL